MLTRVIETKIVTNYFEANLPFYGYHVCMSILLFNAKFGSNQYRYETRISLLHMYLVYIFKNFNNYSVCVKSDWG